MKPIDLIKDLPIVSYDIDKVIPYPDNAKIHADAQIEKIAKSIKEFGFDQPIVVDGAGVIIKGHGRRLAALSLGMKKVPVVVRDDLTEAQVKAARLADNKVAEGEIDTALLQKELMELAKEDPALLDMMGFDARELDFMTQDITELDDSAFVSDLDEAVAQVEAETTARIQAKADTPVPLSKAFGFKSVPQSAERAINAFMLRLRAETGLPPEQAFAFSARMADPSTIEIRYRVADGYYLYRDKFAFAADGATLGAADIPRGKVKFDPNFEKEVETFRHQLTLRLPVQAAGPFTLKVTSQGCSDKGLCYPPMESVAELSPADAGNDAAPATIDSEMGRIEASLASGRLVLILPLFLLLGLGLSFTPCVLPMVPILSFIIAGEGAHTSRSRGLIVASSSDLS